MIEVVNGVFLLCLAVIVSGDNYFRPDYKYYSSAEGWFKHHRVPAKWEDARILCDFEGAVLASPLDGNMAAVMYSAIINQTEHQYFGVYTGIHNTITPTKYHSIEGVPLDPVRKNEIFSEEYNSAPSCMRLVPEAGLVAGSCNDSLPYMCYKKKTAELEVTECGTVDKGYQLDKRTGHCYKFHHHTLRWQLAFLRCDAEGGYLAIANSLLEIQVFKDLYARYPSSTIIGGHKEVTHLGFYNWNGNGIWRTIHGQSLDEAGYNQWSKGQPDHYENVGGIAELCGTMFRTGLYNDLNCKVPATFICEMDPKSDADAN